jgi:hypothetical protein
MSRIEYHITLRTKIVQIILCLLLIAFGLWFIENHASLVAKSIGVLFTLAWVACCMRLSLRLPKRVVRLTLDDSGIHDTSLGTPLIPWNDLVAAKTVFFYGNFIAFLPVDESDRIKRMSWIRRLGVLSNRCFGLPPFCINPGGLNVSSREICDQLRSRLENVGFVRSDRE